MKRSLHNRCYFFAFSRRAKASAKRARSARHVARQGKPTWDKTATFFFLKKSYAKVMRNIVFMCVLQLEIHFSRVNDTHSVGVWSFRLRINLLHLWTVKAKWITLKLRPGWIVTKSSWQDCWLLFFFVVKQLTEDELQDPGLTDKALFASFSEES